MGRLSAGFGRTRAAAASASPTAAGGGGTKGRPSVPPLGAWPSGGRFLPGSGQGLWSWHIPQTAGGQCAPWAPPPGPRAPTAGGTRAVQPVPLCPCAPVPLGRLPSRVPRVPRGAPSSLHRLQRRPQSARVGSGRASRWRGLPARARPDPAAARRRGPLRPLRLFPPLPLGGKPAQEGICREVAATLVFALDAAQCC